MAETVTLPFWPSTFQCLSWSDEDQIAVAGSEQVAILCPRFTLDDTSEPPSREIAVFKVNGFTAAEAPLLLPLSWNRFSLGEELSRRFVLALAWSSSGLATQRRCALAVLTSNHVLSIWDCNGMPRSAESWHRTAIINHGIREFYSTDSNGATPAEPATVIPSTDSGEALQAKQRIRAFAWAEPLDITVIRNDRPHHLLEWGEHIMAVATEAGDILLLTIQNPNLVVNSDTEEWTFRVEHQIICASQAAERTSYSPLNSPQPIIVDMAWSHWTYADDCGWANIAYVMDGELFCVKVECRHSLESSAITVCSTIPRRLLSLDYALTAPLSFRPNTHDVAVAADDRIWCINTFRDDVAINKKHLSSHHLDGRIDPVTGFAWANGLLSVVSHLSTASAKTTKLSLPLHKQRVSQSPTWQKTIIANKLSYGIGNGFAGQVQERTWGIAMSPFGDYAATCITLLPSKSLAYIIQSDQQCTVSITLNETLQTKSGKGHLGHEHSSKRRTAEALISHHQRRTIVEEQATNDSTVLLDYDIMSATTNMPHTSSNAAIPATPKMHEIIPLLRARFFAGPDMRAARAQCLYNVAHRKRNLIEFASPQIVRGLVESVLGLPRGIFQTTGVSSLILRIFEKVNARLISHGVVTENADVETCFVCEQGIPFESVKWAKCRDGHQSWRCSLSLLAIQQPGASRRCALCQARYLNQRGIASLDSHGADQRAQDSLSLLRTLFAACDVCLYCGGKFGG